MQKVILALIMFGIWSSGQSQTVDAAEESANAALQYWLAFSLCPHESEIVSAATTDNEKYGFAIPVSQELAQHFQGEGELALKCLYRGTQLSRCEWGTDLRRDGPINGGEAPYGQRAHELARIALLRARWRFEHGDWDAGIDDVIATMVLGRHIGRDKIGFNVHFGCMLTGMSTGTVAVYLPQMPAQARERLARQLESLPPATSMREVILNHEKSLDWAIENFRKAEDKGQLHAMLVSISSQEYADKAFKYASDAAGLIKLAEAARPLVHQLADAMSLRPDEYDRVFKERFAPQLDANPIAEILGSWYEVARDEEATAHCRVVFVQTAIDVLRRGEIALKDHPDPYGDGPFEYTPFGGGFQLGSSLVYGDLQIQMDFGLRKNSGLSKAEPE